MPKLSKEKSDALSLKALYSSLNKNENCVHWLIQWDLNDGSVLIAIMTNIESLVITYRYVKESDYNYIYKPILNLN